MVWQHPVNPERPFLQVHGCCMYKLTTRNPQTGEITIMDDVEQVRKVVYEMQRKIYAAENIYAQRWEEEDLVIFHNRGVIHSITGQLSGHKDDDNKRRLLWQCTMTSATSPKPLREYNDINDTVCPRLREYSPPLSPLFLIVIVRSFPNMAHEWTIELSVNESARLLVHVSRLEHFIIPDNISLYLLASNDSNLRKAFTLRTSRLVGQLIP